MTRSKNATMFRTMLAKLLVGVMVVSSLVTGGFGISAQAAAQPAISKTKAIVLTGKKIDLDIKNSIKSATYKWKSGNKKIATVNSKGVVTGVQKGTAAIVCTVTTSKVTYHLTSKVTVVQPAEKIVINNKITTVNMGQDYDLNRTLTPSSSNDPTTWKSSDPKVIKLGKWGKFTALKEGTATITATTLSGVSNKVTIKVIDKEGIVTTQKELENLLGSGAGLITLKTEEAVTFTIPEGSFVKQKIVIDAPNADITNNGIFKEVEIKAIKATTWTEKAAGNVITVLALKANIIIDKAASASINVNAGTVLSLVNNGIISALTVNAKSAISISGTSTAAIPVTNNAVDASISTSIPLALVSNAKFALTVLPGAEATTLTAASKEVIPTITGNVTINVTIGAGENAQVETVSGTTGSGSSSSGSSGSGSGSGSGSSGSSTSTKTITKSADGSYTLPVIYTKLKKVIVKYNGISYTVDSSLLSTLQGFLNNEAATISTWKNTTDTTKTYSGQEVTVSGKKGSTLKTITFSGGLLDGKTYQVDIDETSNAVTVMGGSGTSYVISKSSNNKTLYITDAPENLSFVVTY